MLNITKYSKSPASLREALLHEFPLGSTRPMEVISFMHEYNRPGKTKVAWGMFVDGRTITYRILSKPPLSVKHYLTLSFLMEKMWIIQFEFSADVGSAIDSEHLCEEFENVPTNPENASSAFEDICLVSISVDHGVFAP